MNAPISIRTAQERRNDALVRALKRDHATAWAHVGGLSAPSKMPGLGYSLPASTCQVGGRLAHVPGSTCYKCYALRGHYMYDSVQNALGLRFSSLSNLDAWVAAMCELIAAALAMGAEPFFRWHDSGDLQSVAHLQAIAEIARAFPQVSFWLPTREYGYVTEWRNSGGSLGRWQPKNLCIRLSAHMVDGPAPVRLGLPVSTVHSKEAPQGYACPAATQGNFCGECRACWQPSVPHVSYHKH